ncbi:VOC family protein [Mucilaginibacter sp.]|uniref:VOC family protein n=1 Tax=Mucilaginibacter sp. TaxID=1882438 RepID=UPI003D09C5C8
MIKVFTFPFYKIFCAGFLAVIIGISFPIACHAQNNDNQPTFNHAALCARDLKKTAAFYSKALQLKEIKNPFNDTTHVWFKIGEGLALHIIHGDCPETVHNIGIHICFSVPSLDKFIAHLAALKVTYSNWAGVPDKIQVRTDGVKQIYIQDPDGFWVEVNDAK